MSVPGKIVDRLIERYPNQSTEVALRYLPVIRFLKRARVKKVLEVGSGDLGLTPYSTDFDLTGLDTAFESSNPDMTQVTGTALALPFPDRSFDAAVSIDSLEHIEPERRREAVREVIRVAKRLAIIAVPSGKDAEAQDRSLAERYELIKGREYQFFADHLMNGLPDRQDLQQVVAGELASLGRTAEVSFHRNTNLKLRELLMKGWISRNKLVYNLTILGLLPLAGFLRRLNFGSCYRTIIVIDLID